MGNLYRKTIATLSVVASLSVLVSTPTYAENPTSAPVAKESVAEKKEITLQEASKLAIWFMADNIKSNPDCIWNSETRIAQVTTLYDAEDTVTGYAVQFTKNETDNGYIVVSAMGDQNLIQEYAYEGTPLFNSITDGQFDKAYYVAPLTYAVKNGGGVFGLDDLSKKSVKIPPDKLKNQFKHNLNKLYNNKEALNKIRTVDFNLLPYMGFAGTASNASGYGGITDTTAYVNDKYGSGWTAAYYGTLQPNIYAHLLSDFEPNVNNCTLVGLTTIFEYYRTNSIMSSIPSSNSTLYSDVKKIASDKYGYTAVGGTPPLNISSIATDLMRKYGNTSGSSNSVYVWTWSTITDDIDRKRPLLCNINSGYYTNHTVVVVGYNAYSRNWYDNNKEFFKVYDGYTYSNRYIDWDEFSSTNGPYASFTHINP
ncbi:hypothetical protein [Tumebacillus permanentifrigoris]|uniref:Peptidase C39-like protein n=1 Tax=Tumebacillus permanentifrigoris TaxID=378543 RepID=A0A316DE22_9BACL|nr:hypothetical protein [Tumebacillus permanentifrigoris]PWK15772.1 hypothetical protein C7459_10212 [Tumebacillus permanentifrigoris]